MLSYDDVRQRPDQFLACTDLTVDEFDILLDSFSRAWDISQEKRCQFGRRKAKTARSD